MHTTSDTLEKFVPLEVLPNEAGGQAGPLQDLHDKQIEKLTAHADWFKEEEANCRVDESLRPGKAKTATDLFGVEGSFKKLDIDWSNSRIRRESLRYFQINGREFSKIMK